MSDQANPAPRGVSPGDRPETGRQPDAAGNAGSAGAAGGVDGGRAAAPADAAELLRVRAGLRPAPPPLEVDTFTLVLVGVGLWAVAFLALLPVRHEHRLWLEICATGFGLGLIGLVLTRNRRYRRGRTR